MDLQINFKEVTEKVLLNMAEEAVRAVISEKARWESRDSPITAHISNEVKRLIAEDVEIRAAIREALVLWIRKAELPPTPRQNR